MGWVVSMAQAIKLGLQLEMFVSPRAVDSFVAVDRPLGAPEGAGARLIFYDTIPGGSGYLRRLHERFPDIAARAHQHLTRCQCEHACYGCLKEYWNQRDHGLLDKQRILPSLALLAQEATTRPQPAMSQREQFDSFVESELFQRLDRAGIDRPRFGRENILRAPSGQGIIQMDLSWAPEHLMVLIDGREFHSREGAQILADQDKRNEALAAGWRVLEYTAWEVLTVPDRVTSEINQALAGTVTASTVTLDVSGRLPDALAILGDRGFAGSGVVSADAVSLPALAIRSSDSAAVIAVDAERWIADPTVWRAQLAAMRQLTLGGVSCYRIPTERLDDELAVRQTLIKAGLL
jgi:very-short-patch-repair endonuclease